MRPFVEIERDSWQRRAGEMIGRAIVYRLRQTSGQREIGPAVAWQFTHQRTTRAACYDADGGEAL